jgi:selenocysteine lyase/cysteine desulfurase
LITEQKLTIQNLYSEEQLRTREFPVVNSKIFLAHAAVSPLPKRVADSIVDYATKSQYADQELEFGSDRIRTIRELAATLIGAQKEEIALIGPTSLGLSIVAGGIKFEPCDNVLIYFDDYPSNVYPWIALESKGVKVRKIATRFIGKIETDEVLSQIDNQTRLVALSSCHFLSGWRIDIDQIGAELRKRGILFCLDAIQTLGAFPISVENVDFLAADAHKWLLGPCGAGIFYVRRDLQERLSPLLFGWHNVRCPNFIPQDKISFPPGARKYEPGTMSLGLLAGLQAALELITEVGVENITRELLKKRKFIIEQLKQRDFKILCPDSSEKNSSAIISFYKENLDIPVLHRFLIDNRIITSLRTDRQGNKYIRLSPHFYNTQTEIEHFFDVLDKLKC